MTLSDWLAAIGITLGVAGAVVLAFSWPKGAWRGAEGWRFPRPEDLESFVFRTRWGVAVIGVGFAFQLAGLLVAVARR